MVESIFFDSLIRTRLLMQEDAVDLDPEQCRSELDLLHRMNDQLRQHSHVDRENLGDLSALNLPAKVVDFWFHFFHCLEEFFRLPAPPKFPRRRQQARFQKMTAIEQAMGADLDWARTAPEVQQHKGNVVAVFNRQVLAVGPNHETVFHEAAERRCCPPNRIVTIVVPDPELALSATCCIDAATEIEQQMLADLKWGKAALEVQQHVGKIVAICGTQILAVGEELGKVLDEAASLNRCPRSRIVTIVVPGLEDA